MIEADGLVKGYGLRETSLVVDNVTFSLPRGARFGILGAERTGKSALLRILATVLRPTQGTARVGGFDILDDRAEVRKLVGYTPQHLDLRGWRSGREYLRFWARASGLASETQRVRVGEVSTFLELGTGGADLEGNPALYTIGLQKRLSLAQALLTDPPVLLLDELLMGLGDVGRQFFVERLERLKADGKTIVMSSRFLGAVRATCERVALMSAGRLTRVFGIDELLARIGQGKDARIFIDCDELSPDATAELRKLKGVIEVRSATTATIVYVTPMEVDVEAIRKTLRATGVEVRDIREAQLRLGDVFSALHT